MIDEENAPRENAARNNQEADDLNFESLEEQEQRNSDDLVQRIEEENQAEVDYGDVNGIIDQASRGEEDLSSFLDRTLPGSGTRRPADDDSTPTKNLLGDNPPGSEQAAFDAGNKGDMTSGQAMYNAEDIAENFRDNIDKTQSEIDLDNRLRDESTE